MGIFGVFFSNGFRKKTRGCFNCFLIRSTGTVTCYGS
jgi:hypothetical protein